VPAVVAKVERYGWLVSGRGGRGLLLIVVLIVISLKQLMVARTRGQLTV
jgi:lipid-binding SYLF domain-containing protein